MAITIRQRRRGETHGAAIGALAVLLVAAWGAAASAQQVGDVVRVNETTSLQVGIAKGEDVASGATFVVNAVNGDWLWIKAGKEGWIPKNKTALVEGAGARYAKLTPERQKAVAATWRRGAKLTFSDQGDVLVVDLSGCDVSKAEVFAELKPLAATIQEFGLRLSSVNDDSLAGIAEFTNLTALSLGGNPITDKSLTTISKLTQLRSLGLMATPVTDAAMEQVAKLTNLEELRLTVTGVSDAGLAKLTTLKKLKVLEVTLTNVSFVGAQEFEKKVPGVKVTR